MKIFQHLMMNVLIYIYIYLFIYLFITHHFKWVHLHHGMARHQDADGGDGFQVWRTNSNIQNKKSRITDKGWFSSLGAGRGAVSPHRKNGTVLRNVKQNLGFGRILWNEIRKGKWT
jgi:hypothetical protein